ncbi:MAG: hypothetical protein ACK56F_23290 [bacterium]
MEFRCSSCLHLVPDIKTHTCFSSSSKVTREDFKGLLELRNLRLNQEGRRQ